MKSKATVFFLLLWMLGPLLARAHDPFESTGIGRIVHRRIELQVTMPRVMAAQLLPEADRETADPASFNEDIVREAPGFIDLTADGTALTPIKTVVRRMPNDEIDIVLIYPQPPPGTLRVRASYLEKLGGGYRGMIAFLDEDERSLGSKLLNPRDVSLEISTQVAPPVAPSTESVPEVRPESPAPLAPPAPRVSHPSFGEFLRLGIEHILTGYDHLLFLCALLVIAARVSSVLVIVSCFTLAHSITLALAALDLVSVSPHLVEPLIAASIVFVGVENLLLLRRSGSDALSRSVKPRALVAFGFGLIHGFGFASVLKETGLGMGGNSIALPLLSFNLGVELGQIAVAVVFVPLLWQLRKIPGFARYGPVAISVAVILLGAFWLLDRTVFS